MNIGKAEHVPAGRTAANPHGTAFLWVEGQRVMCPNSADPRGSPGLPLHPRATQGCSLLQLCPYLLGCLLTSSQDAGRRPAHSMHFHSHCQSIIKSIRGRRKQHGSQCTFLPHLPIGFLCQPQADMFSLVVTSAHSLNAVK